MHGSNWTNEAVPWWEAHGEGQDGFGGCVCVPAGLPAGPGRAALMASCATASQFRNN